MSLHCKEILDDPCASKWLKKALSESLDRDLVDAINDIETLLETLKEKFEETLLKKPA